MYVDDTEVDDAEVDDPEVDNTEVDGADKDDLEAAVDNTSFLMAVLHLRLTSGSFMN